MLHTKILEATISGWVGLWYSRVGPGRANNANSESGRVKNIMGQAVPGWKNWARAGLYSVSSYTTCMLLMLVTTWRLSQYQK